MSWYYADNGKQVGPITDADLESLLLRGTVRDDTLVWKEGMAKWQPYGEVKPAGPALLIPPPAATAAGGPAGEAAAAAPLVAGEVVCTECGRSVPRENTIQYGAAWVCATCKPVFVQKLKEGADLTAAGAGLSYAGFWIRFVAKFMDGLIIMVVVGLPLMVLLFGRIMSGRRGGAVPAFEIGLQLLFQAIWVFGGVAYNTFFLGKFGATPGKMAVGIKVTTPEGQPISYLRAFGRAWAEQLSGLICNIGYIIAAFDDQKRALHDHICNTRVSYK